ncbi:MAG: RidA family protein [Candidatus Dadabacteria bacterium]|nr:MAG: RidA family protein [Candidatus Dadabacteria bacterium]
MTADTIEKRLRAMGITLPPAPVPLGAYVPCVRTGNLLFLSGMLPLVEGGLLKTGRVGETVTLEEAKAAARQAVINALSVVNACLGGLDMVARCVKLSGFVASGPDFAEQPKVLNAASELLAQVFGEQGRHARVAVGVPVLPLHSPIEIDLILEIREPGLSR